MKFCPNMSAVKIVFGKDARTADIEYARVEDQEDVWQGAARIGRLIGERIQQAHHE